MNQTRGVCVSNTNIGAEWGKYGKLKSNYAVKDEKFDGSQGFRRKPMSDATRATQAAELRTNRRSNWCGACHMTKATGTGLCGCDE
jgi:hypothetical protein